MHGWCWFGLHKGDIYPKLAAILIDLVDSEFWWVEIEPVKKACELALESTSLSSKSPLLRLLPIDALLSKGPVPLAVQVSCSTLSLRTGQDFEKANSPLGLLCCIYFSALERPTPSSVALWEVQVSQPGSGAAGGRWHSAVEAVVKHQLLAPAEAQENRIAS